MPVGLHSLRMGSADVVGRVMKYGPITHRRMLAEALRLRKEERLSGPQIAKRLSTTIGWVRHQLNKFDMSAKLSIVASPENLARALEMRSQGIRWKTIARELGVERWESLARAIYVKDKTK